MGSVAAKTVFITGAARGVGAEVARRLHRKGARLVLTDLDAAPLAELVSELGGDRVQSVVADVRDLEAMQNAAASAVDRFGGIDIVIANAGIATYGSVLQVDPKAFQTMLDVNIMGVFHTVRATLPSVIDRRGYVLIVSSLAAYAPAPGLAPYNAAKAAVEQFASALRLEVGYRGVDVGSAHMSWIDTPLVRDSRADMPTFAEFVTKLPFPLNKTTSVEACGRAFVSGIEKRRRHVNCPGWVGALRWLKPVLSSVVGDRQVAALGRSMSSRIEELEG